jgi:tetratricopeptide (TPR) repeat protein
MKRDLAIGAALVIATLAVYAQTLRFDFIEYDDQVLVTQNRLVHAGISTANARAAFAQQSDPLNWLPLTVLSYMVEATVFGVEPSAFHATNVLLHALDAVLLYLLLRSLTAAVWPAAIAAALFALHPMRAESVAWVSSRKDVLSAAFGLLALIAYLRYARRGSVRAYAVSFACTVAALLSKATWVTLPALFLLLDFWPLRRFGPSAPEAPALPEKAAPRVAVSELIAEKLPFFGIAAAMLLVTSVSQAANRVSLEKLPLVDRLVHALVSCAWYVAKTLWPAQLSPHYAHPYMVGGGVPWTATQIALAVLSLATLTALAIRFARRGYPLVGWLWFLGTLVPVLGLAQYGNQGMADRYTHIPHMGLFVAAVFGGWEILAPRLRSPRQQRLAVASVVAALLALGSAAFAQVRVWRDTESLFTHAMQVRPRDATIQQSVGYVHLIAGRFDESLRHSKIALNLNPNHSRARYVLVQALKRRAAATPPPPEPDFLFDGEVSDALVHQELAELAYARGDRDAALDHIRGALALDPDSIRALWQLGALSGERGDHAGATDAFRRVVELRPDSPEAREALAAAERELASQR